MLKRAKLKIRSVIDELDSAGLPMGDPEITDESYTSSFLIRGGEYRMSYTADTEGGKLTSDVLVGEDGIVTVARHGAIESMLLFGDGKVFNTVYTVPPYKFDMQIKTLRLSVSLDEHGGSIDILYLMTVGGASKKCKMRLTAEVIK